MNILLGIGNTLRGDDGIGPYVARIFRKEDWISLDCGTTPENFTAVIRKECPSLVILVDAAELNLPPGEFRVIPLDRIEDVSVGTHGPSLGAFIDYISSFVPQVVFIGIQPGHIGDTSSLSRRVRGGADALVKVLREKGIAGIELYRGGNKE